MVAEYHAPTPNIFSIARGFTAQGVLNGGFRPIAKSLPNRIEMNVFDLLSGRISCVPSCAWDATGVQSLALSLQITK
jgi:hypothetical protein